MICLVHDGADQVLVARGPEWPEGRFSVLAGFVEPGESLEDAVAREVKEEAGIEGVCGPLIGWVERIDDDHHFVILDFSVDVLEGTEPVAGDDAVERILYRPQYFDKLVAWGGGDAIRLRSSSSEATSHFTSAWCAWLIPAGPPARREPPRRGIQARTRPDPLRPLFRRCEAVHGSERA